MPLCHSVFLEMLHLSYFVIFNGYGSVGTQLVRDIEFRGRHDSLASVLMVSSSSGLLPVLLPVVFMLN